ncbi:NINE protein [Paenibacillus kyungheensis]
MSKKSKMIDIIVCLCLAIFGVHQLYEGKIVTGILYLFTYVF